MGNADDAVRVWSVGETDACLWSIRTKEDFVLLSRLSIISDTDDKINCSLLVDDRFLVVGTTLGHLYRLELEEEDKNNTGFPSIEGIVWNSNNNDAAITSLAWD